MSGTLSRRTITMDDDLWADAVRAAGEQSSKEGRSISVSAWIRRAMRERLEREETDGRG